MTWVVIAVVLWVAVIVAVETGLVGRLASPLEPAGPDIRPAGYGRCPDYVPASLVREYEESRP